MTLSPNFRTSFASSDAPSACANGSPPSKVIPSMPCDLAPMISDNTDDNDRLAPPLNDRNSGLQQPGQRSGQPWNQMAKRLPGPSASVQGTICAIDRVIS